MSKQTKAKVPTVEDLLKNYTLAEAGEILNKLQDYEREALLCAIWKIYHKLNATQGV